MSLNLRPRIPAILLLALLAALLPARRVTAQDPAGDADYRAWGEAGARGLTLEGNRLKASLDACVDALRDRMTGVEDAAASTEDDLHDPRAAFRFLVRELGPAPELMGLPMGVHLVDGHETLAWTGFPIPLSDEERLDPGAGPRFSLRNFGIHQFLTVRGRLPGTGGLEWACSLPLAHRLPGNEGGLPVLLAPPAGHRLRILPPVQAAPDADSSESASWDLGWGEGVDLPSSFKQGLGRYWTLDQAGARILELRLRGPSEPQFRLRSEQRRRLVLGSGALILIVAAGLLLRSRLRRGRPEGLPLAARAPFIVAWVLLLRFALLWAGLPGGLLEGPFWGSGRFALALPGFGSPGEFLISTLAALLILILLLRPYLHPDAGDEQEGADEAAPGARPGRLLLALFAPLLGVVAASGFAVLVYVNAARDLLYQERLLSGDALGFNVALFLASSFLLSLFLVPAHFAWRRLPTRRGARLAATLPLLILALLLVGAPAALALLLILPVAWGFRRAAARLTGLLFHVVFVILAVTLVVEGARDRVLDGAAAHEEILRGESAEGANALWQPLLVERVLLDLARDPGIRRQLDDPAGADPWLAMAAWQHSGLTALGERGSLEIHDDRGRLESRYLHEVELPEAPGHPPARAGRPDLTLVVDQTLATAGADSFRLVTGDVAMVAERRRPLGFLTLNLLMDEPPAADAERTAAVESSLARRLLSGSQRLFLHLAVLGLLLLVDLLFSRFRLVRRYLPPLIGPRGAGFQHKLLGAFLLVALLPVVLTGLIAGRQIRAQEDAASSRASLERALSARRSLENRVRQDARDLAASEYVRNFVAPDFPQTVRDIGSLERNRIMIFGAEGDLLLDESLRNWGPAQVDSFLAVLSPGRVVYEREGGRIYGGLLLPMEIWHREQRIDFSVYYRLLLDTGLLDDLGDVVGGPLNLYGGGSLLHAGSPEIFGLGYQSPMLDPATVAALDLGGEPHHQSVDRVGERRFGRSTVPLLDAAGRPAALLSSLDAAGLAGPRAALEGGGLVFSMIALLMVLALGLGSFLAGRVFLPIRRLQMGTRRLSAGDLGYRLPPEGRDEIGELVRGFNSMAEGLEAATDALEDRRRFLESILANVASGVLAFDADGRLRSLNPAARDLLGLGATELEGLSLAGLRSLEVAPGAQFFAHLADHPEGLRGAACELRVVAAGGARSFRMADADTGGGRVVVFEDVTELIRSQKLAAWSEMARQVAHEIKNPLTPIKLSAQFVGRAWRDEKENFGEILEDGLGSIGEQVEILRRIAAEFSQFGRRQELKPEPLDLAALLNEVLAPYRGETLQVEWSGIETLTVTADREALRKVLLNLVENARQAMEGSGRLGVSLASRAGRTELALRDHGPGIPEEALERLFEPYFSTKTSGTGLGLAISAQLVEEMGGELSVKNHPEGGAVATLALEIPVLGRGADSAE